MNTVIYDFLPIFFLIALGLAFATGTSWGTFGILIPIAIAWVMVAGCLRYFDWVSIGTGA